ncbi:hypothetical protein [Clostridium sp. Marseille-Q2269]|uniref:phage tail assembly chaperone G n=1 Tax=Clostridium sp. Marseille-Q2269 TaxID=2942205 RepID=UPI002073BCCD|nr:hypothetical protein [Clostridium sp. Marseille-Q2269]
MKIIICEKTYEQTKFKGRITRNLLEIQQHLEEVGENFKASDLDLLCQFIVNVFDNEFTTDDLLDEFEYSDIILTFRKITDEINKKTKKKFEQLAKK